MAKYGKILFLQYHIISLYKGQVNIYIVKFQFTK